MPSKLNNLFRTLTWNDFQKVNRAAPPPGVIAEAAEIPVDINVAGVSVVNSSGGVRLADSVQATVQLGRCTVSSWVFNQPQSFQTALLKHEQGHYDLTALIARDWFLALMRLKLQVFANAQALQKALNDLDAATRKKAQPVISLYDSRTTNGTNAQEQAKWDGFIQTAFKTAATPPEQTPDGTTIKVTLLGVLKQAGLPV